MGCDGGFALSAGFDGVTFIKIAVAVKARHIIHRGGNGCFNAGISSGCIQAQTAEAADTDDADSFRVDFIAGAHVVNGCQETLGLDFWFFIRLILNKKG